MILFSLTSTVLFAREPDSVKCEKSKAQAQSDLKCRKVYLMLQGGFAPIRIDGREHFEKKYQVNYIDLGCVIPNNLCITAYNAEVAKFLDQKYGKGWRKEVWKGAVGI